MGPRRAILAFSGAALLLSGRLQAATIVVNDVSDTLHDSGCAATGTGTCTLRDAITFSNAKAGKDEIDFNIAGAGVQRIDLQADMPEITDPVTIDGYTQPGSSSNTNGPGLADNAVLGIEITSDEVSILFDELVISCGGTTIRGLVFSGSQSQGPLIYVTTKGGNVFEGNFIGANPSGTAMSLLPRRGIYIENTSPNNVIGGIGPG